MNCKIFLSIILISLPFLSGCATSNFVKIPGEQLHLGQDRLQDIQGRFGKPSGKNVIVRNGKSIKVIQYNMGPFLSMRLQAFHFYNDVLIGYLYHSTVKEDSTNFDESKIKQIKEGETKIDDVIVLLGQPCGEYTYPLIENENEKAKIYFYVDDRIIKLRRKRLVISYDINGIVTKIDFSQFGWG